MRKTNVNRLGVRRAKSVVAEAIEPRWLMSTYTVNTLSDAANPGAGLVTLRQAVASANSHAGADTIAFAANVFTAGSQHKIVLTQGQIAFTDTSGATTVSGPGSSLAAIDGNSQSRLFSIVANATVSISGLTLTDGKQVAADADENTRGGAILNAGTLTIANSTLSGNSVSAIAVVNTPGGSSSAGEGLGGAIYSTGSLTVTGSLLSMNTVVNIAPVDSSDGSPAVGSGAAYGGAIYSTASLSLTDDSISNNSTTASNADGVVQGEIAGGPAAGGGVYGGGSVMVLRSIISGNSATGGFAASYGAQDGGDARGGGAFAGGALTMTDCTVSGNKLRAGDSSFDEGESGIVQGGGVYTGAIAHISNTNISDNEATAGAADFADGTSGGGGVYAGSDATLSADEIEGNSLTGGPGAYPGAPSPPAGTPTTAGGGVFCGGKLVVTISTISGNSAGSRLEQGVSEFRVGGLNVGGGIAVNGSSSIDRSTVAENAVVGGSGYNAMGLYQATVGGDGDGGGIYNASSLTITNSTIADNSATGGSGGGGDQQFSGADGGDGSGGGIYNIGSVVVLDSTVTGNITVAGAGGGPAGYDYNPGNTPGVDGTAAAGGIDIASGSAVFNNSIISANTAANLFNDIVGNAGSTSANNLIGIGGGLANDARGNKVGINNPMLSVLGDNGGPTLTMLPLVGSPVIDAGNNELIPSGVTVDQRGFARIAGGTVDIGATEMARASISGTVFDDVNKNGKRESGEAGLAGIVVYNDVNNNGVLDGTEMKTMTDSSGHYVFTQLNPGSYKIRQVLPLHWQQTAPANGFGWTITLANNQQSSGDDFGQFSNVPIGGSISGEIFNDANSNGTIESGEAGIAGIIVYSDANNNGILDNGEEKTLSDTSGNYILGSLAPGNYKVREVLPAGWKQTTPGNNFGWTLSVAMNQAVPGKNFGQQKISSPIGASISGTIFNDANGNGKEDSGEAGLSAWTLFIDTNNDGIMDNGELTAMTKVDGSYSFSGLAAGAYIVRALRPSGWNQTTPTNNLGQHVTVAANQSKTGVMFGEHSAG